LSLLHIFTDHNNSNNQRATSNIAFKLVLFVRTTIVKRNTNECAVIDTGLMASSGDLSMPTAWHFAQLSFIEAVKEHGLFRIIDTASLSLGDELMFMPGHCPSLAT
jgi:D-serine deaminase-like pyridoxal phosphate-dependent protein